MTDEWKKTEIAVICPACGNKDNWPADAKNHTPPCSAECAPGQLMRPLTVAETEALEILKAMLSSERNKRQDAPNSGIDQFRDASQLVAEYLRRGELNPGTQAWNIAKALGVV